LKIDTHERARRGVGDNQEKQDHRRIRPEHPLTVFSARNRAKLRLAFLRLAQVLRLGR
jgi:hypothetical protein